MDDRYAVEGHRASLCIASFPLGYTQRSVASSPEATIALNSGAYSNQYLRKSPLRYACGFLEAPTISFAGGRALNTLRHLRRVLPRDDAV